MFDVIVIGSASIDLFVETGSRLFRNSLDGSVMVPFGSKIPLEDLYFAVGGGGTNVACALARLGHKTAFMGKTGTDMNSLTIRDYLQKEGVDTTYLLSEDGPSDMAIILDAHGRERTILTYKKKNSSLGADEVDMEDMKADWLYFSTMLGRSLDTQKEMAILQKERGAKIMFNPSAYLLYEGMKTSQEILSMTDIVILNMEEAHIMAGSDVSAVKAAEMLLDMGLDIAIVTDGDRGAFAVSAEKGYHIETGSVKVVETTGAGDGFAGGFLSQYIRTGNLKEALVAGALEAESVISYRGAKKGLLTKDELDRRMKDDTHKIHRIK